MSHFDLLLHLVDFSRLRPVLAHLLGWTSARGQVPFDPVSMFLLICWQVVNGWKRSQVLKNIRNPLYADSARRFGFQPGIFPTEGGLRHFQTTLGQNSDVLGQIILVETEDGLTEIPVQALNQLIAQSVDLLHQAGLLSQPAWQQALICPDGMLLEAASRLRCTSVCDTCYQPTSSHKPRPCPAKDKGRRGCKCESLKCALICRHAPSRDFGARYVWYEGSNQPKLSPNQLVNQAKQPKRGKGIYGYLTTSLQLADPVRRFPTGMPLAQHHFVRRRPLGQRR